MHVVKFTHVGEAALEHLRVGQCGESLELIRVDALDESIHELAPAPERVVRRPATLGQPGQASLEGVAMQIPEAGDADGVALIPLPRRHSDLNALDPALLGADPNLIAPALRQECRCKPQPHDQSYNGSVRGLIK